ncbi:MAG: hypothetical protein NT027_00865 [Proteobacteria bacterium]|nr:hypothetical protein [Pseudomonadota bacterium]
MVSQLTPGRLLAENKLNFRKVPKSVGHSFCEGNFAPIALWNGGLFDSQVEGKILKSTAKLSSLDVGKVALEFAKRMKYRSYSFGFCTSRVAWIVAFPALDGLSVVDGRFLLTESSLRSCKGNIEIRSVSAQVEVSILNDIAKLRILSHDGSEKRNYAIECIPDDKYRDGPEEWFFYSTGRAMFDLPLGLSGSILRSKESIASAINKIRIEHKLLPIKLNSSFEPMLNEIQNEFRIQHDLPSLIAFRSAVKKLGWEFIGESRAKASNVLECLKLMWNSPRHRDLLLSENVSEFAVDIQDIEGLIYLNLVGVKKL